MISHVDDCSLCQELFEQLEAESSQADRFDTEIVRASDFAQRLRRFVRGETLASIELFDESHEPPKQLGDYRIRVLAKIASLLFCFFQRGA